MKHPFQFYNWDMPQIGENVIVKIISNDDGIVNAKLLEYDLSGLIIIREGSRKAYRKLKPLLAIDKEVTVEISEMTNKIITLHLDTKINQNLEKFNKNKRVISMFETLSHKTGRDFTNLWKDIIYPLQTQDTDIYDILKDKSEKKELLQELTDILMKSVKEDKTTVHTFKIINPTDEGIYGTKRVLIDIMDKNKDINIKLKKTPEYNLEIYDNSEERIQEIKNTIKLAFDSKVNILFL